jgi:3-deoxy-D-manno-octulosonate 8-phosphate phosphatase (KDO 8-P phosphatase)
MDPNLTKRLSRIKLLVTDVDGTLTEGSMVFVDGGQVKLFHVHDGLGIRLARNFGLDVAIVTGNVSHAVAERAATLGLERVYQGVRHKSAVIDQMAAETGLARDEIAYIGDDLNDLPAFDRVGFRIAVGDAVEEIKGQADMITAKPGGRGAVREAIEAILKARGQWEEAVRSFLAELEREDAGKPAPEAVA